MEEQTIQEQTGLEFNNAFLEGIKHAKFLAVDTETTGLRVKEGEDYLMGISMAYRAPWGVVSEYFPLRHKTGNIEQKHYTTVLEALTLSPKPLVFHNRKFDMHSLATLDKAYDTSNMPVDSQYDTMLMAHLLFEDFPRSKSLEACAQHYIQRGKTDLDAMKRFTDQFGWSEVPPSLMANYAKGDAEVTLELFERLLGLCMKKFGDQWSKLWEYEIKMQNALYKMESQGISVDLKFCREYAGVASLEMLSIEEELGFTPSKTTELAKFLFDDLKLPVLETTPAGKPSLAKNVMEEYDRMLETTEDHRARLVLNYRGWQKASSSFYTPFQNLVDTKGKIHANYKQHGTATGRLSCAEPNLQQIPRSSDKVWNGKIRSAFQARDGYKLLGFDYSQLELRLAAAYGDEKLLIEEFHKPDADPFTAYSEIIGADRYTTKTFFYAMIYGAGQSKIAKTLKKNPEDIADQYEAFKASIPGILDASRLATARAKGRGYIKYWTGRRRHFRNPEDSYKAFNALLQGGGAEVVKRVLSDIQHDLAMGTDCIPVLQVHDELVFEVKEDKISQFDSSITAYMEALPTEIFGLPFKVSGKLWGTDD